MRRLLASVLILAAIGSASGVANAQKGLSTGMNVDAIDRSLRIDEEKQRTLAIPRKAGLEALAAQNFVEADKQFADLLSRNPTTSDANYLMGLAKMGQKNWADAKTYLEVAVVSEPKRPDPKGRLAVAAIMVNDIETAQYQRSELVKMKTTCGSCQDANAIAGNLTMVDKVIAAVNAQPAAPAATPAPTAPAAPPQGN